MSRIRLFGLVAVCLVLVALPACGGGGQGLRVTSDPVKVMSTSLPAKLSGETMNHVIPLDGGCGGPYVLKVISGRMPSGLELDDENHALTGYLGEDGDFNFTIEVTDTGCTPFSSTTATFSMSVGIGDLTVVAVRKDGNPAKFIAPGEGYSPADERPPEEQTPYNPGYPALPETIFNEYTLIDLVIAGGKGPYEIDIFDAEGVEDVGLPLGTSLIPDSSSIAGTPIEEAPAGAFLLTFQITDSVGRKGFFTAYWLVYSPPLFIASTSISDGVCGSLYSDAFFQAGGIPPFNHDFVVADGSRTLITAAAYPSPTDPGPDYTATLAPSEGMYIEQDAGRFRGIPRRRGTFAIMYHCNSTLLPFSPTQNRWREFTFVIAPAQALLQDAGYTIEGAPFSANPFNRIPDVEVGRPYNPDALQHSPPGLQALARGGVPYDGLSDHPHYSQVLADPVTEVPGSYRWSIDWGVDPMPGMEFTIDGLFRVADSSALEKSAYQDIGLSVVDEALPVSLQIPQEEWVRVGVGPDEVIVTTSSSSFTGGTAATSTRTGLGMDDRDLTVQLLLPYKTAPELKILNESRDMAGKDSAQHEVPTTAGSFGASDPLATILTEVDLLRASVNPNGWWNDVYNLNPRGARGFQHSDANRTHGIAHGNHYGYQYQYYSSWSGTTYKSNYGAQPETSSVHIPDCLSTDVTHDPAAGTFKDGGKLYIFDGEDYFGVFMIRENGKLYVPVAIEKGESTTETQGKELECFGDNMNFAYKSGDPVATAANIPQMTVSPDGRFAAMRVLEDVASFSSGSSSSYSFAYDWQGDDADDGAIVIFSLTGEKLWGGKPYKFITTGSSGSSSYGAMMIAGTMTLTNHHLYYICANRAYHSSYAWREQYVYRYDVLGGGNSGELLRDDLGSASENDPEWTNAPGEWMQLPCGRVDRFYYNYSSGTYKNSYTDKTIYADGYQGHEGSLAPVPFRVNADGDSCVIIAGRAGYNGSSSTYGHSTWHKHHVFLDEHNAGGDPTLFRLSDKLRRIPQGTSRGYALTSGYNWGTHHYGARTGPTPNVEISDDGSKVAVCVSRVSDSTSIYHYESGSYYYMADAMAGNNWRARQDIILFEQKTAGQWTSTGDTATGETVTQVTGTESGVSPVFTSSPDIQWRFGALTFTKDNDGLVFWGGASSYNPLHDYTFSYRYQADDYDSFTFIGSFYSYEFDSGDVANVLAKADGGANLTVGTAQSTIGSTWSTPRNANMGVIKPVGGFLSKNREYLYVTTSGAISTSKKEHMRLVGVNVKNLEGDSTGNSHSTGEGFLVGNWPARRGFTVHRGGYSYPYLDVGIMDYGKQYTPAGIYGSEVVMAKDSGWVFFGAHYQTHGGSTTTTYYMAPFLATYCNYYDGEPVKGQVAVFDADVGGDVHMITSLAEPTGSYSSYWPKQFVKYIEPTADGTALAYVYAGGTAYYYYPVAQDKERIGYLTGLQLDETNGDIVGTYDDLPDLSGSNTRVCSSVSHGPFGDALYYAEGDTNENNKTLLQRSAGQPVDVNYGLSTMRWNILHAAR